MTGDAPADSFGARLLAAAREGAVVARAVLLGEHIDVRGFEAEDMVGKSPLSFRVGGGLVAVFRFGAVAFIAVDDTTQAQTIEALRPRVTDPADPMEVESVALTAATGDRDVVTASGKLALTDFSEPRLLVVADALAKSVALADDERYIRKVFDQIEPFASNLAATGRTALRSNAILQLLGEALVAQARMVGRVEVQEKPDLLWDRPDLQQLYVRLKDEYELDDRARALGRKLKVIEGVAATLADVTDAGRTLRLEIAVVALIAFEIVISLFEMFGHGPG